MYDRIYSIEPGSAENDVFGAQIGYIESQLLSVAANTHGQPHAVRNAPGFI